MRLLGLAALLISTQIYADALPSVSRRCDAMASDSPITDANYCTFCKVSYVTSELQRKVRQLAATVGISGNLNDPDVEIWLTNPDGLKPSIALKQQVPGAFDVATPDAANLIDIDPTHLKQPFEGVGASMTESTAVNLLKMPQSQREKVMKLLFDKKDGAGFGFVRLPIGASDFSDGEKGSYTYNDMPKGQTDPELKNFSIARDIKSIDLIRDAKKINPDITVMISPWTPPPWMKTNGSHTGANWGQLKPEYQAAYAKYLVKSISEIESHGADVNFMSIINEPGYAAGHYPAMLMNADQQRDFIKNDLGPEMKKAGVKTKLLILDHNWGMSDYANEVLDDPEAKKYVGGVAYHGYGSTPKNMAGSIDKHPDIATYQTEMSSLTDNQKDEKYYFNNFFPWWVKNEIIDAFRVGARSAAGWNMVLDENNGPRNGGWEGVRPMITFNQKTHAVSFAPEYFAAAHIGKFVSAGAHVIESSESGKSGLANVAFLNPDGTVVVLAQNDSKKPVTFQIRNSDCKIMTYTLPAQGVATFKWKSPGTSL